ncbi:MAG TPA: response regulator transcription factor [Anaerolineales bacterium]|nr:response regulator transcription factor [Anaerolineales bacterium]
MSKVIKILVVDDHALFRAGLVSVLSKQPDFNVVGEAATIRQTIRLTQAEMPDLVLMDVGLPNGNGVEAMDRLLKIRKDLMIVFLTVHESQEIAFAALRAGAKGYLIKDIDIPKLLVALRALERGELAISRELSSRYIEETTRWLKQRLAGHGGENTLTAREFEVLRELGAGYDNRVIGQRLSISPNTVKVHVNNISHKLGISTRGELVEFSQRHGLTKIQGRLAKR